MGSCWDCSSAGNRGLYTEEENHGFPSDSPTGVKEQKDRMMFAESAIVPDAERSEARCGLENESEFMGFCVQKTLAAQAAHPAPVW